MKIFIALLSLNIFFLPSCSKNNNGNNSSKISATVYGVSDNRKDTANTFRFRVDLSMASSGQASVGYTTTDGTAKSPKDYLAQSGTLVFAPGQTEMYIDVKITGDSLRQPNQFFYVQLSNPKNCIINTQKATGEIINEDNWFLPTDSSGYVSSNSYPGYNLVWSDEFNGNSINTNDWNFETGGDGWGNHELEYYTGRPQNAFVSCGNLIIEARSENYGNNYYTSARLTTQNKRTFLYGRIDIRAKLPVASGMWPALWMLGSNIPQVGWPACGETDIMELIGKKPNQVAGSFHWANSGGGVSSISKSDTLLSGDFSQQFHVFSLTWEKDSMQILIDDHPYSTANSQNVTGGNYPFNLPFFFIFNVAVGGDWPGPPDYNTNFPQRMFVDYVRVFQK
ncbi:MAG: family 16 glycosylhydrolase [Bacteroidetes bacterium]|nr:family 16 glycosylhydrolase [Bacteroidota bacterium]MBS1973825.1 family 16 glycosylhydrolase [Bacteroidota bacterium]